MKSINVVFSAKKTVEIREEAVPALEATEIRCKARKSLISTGTETLCLRGEFDPNTNWASWVKYPFHPGYSMTAEVMEVGSEVKGIKAGDRVTVAAPHKQIFNVDYKSVNPIPEGIRDEQAAWFALATVTQLGARRAELKLGESVGIIGLGQLGQLVTQYMHIAGAGRIIAIDPIKDRLDLALKNGATDPLAMDAGSAIEVIKEMSDGKMLDVVFDVTGHPAVLSLASQLTGFMGRVVLLGDTPTPSKQTLGPNIVSDSISILGIHGMRTKDYHGWTDTRMQNLFYSFLLQDRMNADRLISHRYSPMEAPKLYERLLNDRSSAMGVIFDWEQLD